MKPQLRLSGSPKMLLVLAAVLTVTVFVGAACGTSQSVSAGETGDTHFGEIVNEEGHGHGAVEGTP